MNHDRARRASKQDLVDEIPFGRASAERQFLHLALPCRSVGSRDRQQLCIELFGLVQLPRVQFASAYCSRAAATIGLGAFIAARSASSSASASTSLSVRAKAPTNAAWARGSCSSISRMARHVSIVRASSRAAVSPERWPRSFASSCGHTAEKILGRASSTSATPRSCVVTGTSSMAARARLRLRHARA